MPRQKIERLECTICGAHTTSTQLLRAPNPFDRQLEITGCPVCRNVENFERLCDEPGCRFKCTAGEPTGDETDEWGGYKMSCSEHMYSKQKAKKHISEFTSAPPQDFLTDANFYQRYFEHRSKHGG
jgi:hypothetical protein